MRSLSLIVLLTSVLAGCSAPAPSKPVELTARQKQAVAMFTEHCRTAGEKIHRTVENVERIYLLKIRTTINYEDQFRLDDPYGHDSIKDQYLLNFLRGFYRQQSPNWNFPRIGYFYVEAEDPSDGRRYQYTGERRAVSKKDANAPAVRFELQRDPNYDLNNYDFVLERRPASGPTPRYGVTFSDISTRDDREYWIAGSSLKVIDLQTGEVIAERIGYMVDIGQGSTAGGRSPWLLAADHACPSFNRNRQRSVPGPGFSAQAGQTLDFVQKVLVPVK
jgi:hypothetical protein